MGRAARKRREDAPEDDFTDRTLDRLVDIGGHRLPAYPNHPDRRRARAADSIDPAADTAQLLRWHAAGNNLNGYAKGLRREAEDEDAYSRGWRPPLASESRRSSESRSPARLLWRTTGVACRTPPVLDAGGVSQRSRATYPRISPPSSR